MKITCTGPGGIQFEAEGANWVGGDGVRTRLRNDADRDAMQKALETWCETYKATAETVEPEKSTTADSERAGIQPGIDELCAYCGYLLGKHRAEDGQCPEKHGMNEGFQWAETKFKLAVKSLS